MSASQTQKTTEPKAPAMVRFGNYMLDLWFEPIQPARLRVFEKAFAITFIYYVASWGLFAREWLTTDGFHFTAAQTSAESASRPVVVESWVHSGAGGALTRRNSTGPTSTTPSAPIHAVRTAA